MLAEAYGYVHALRKDFFRGIARFFAPYQNAGIVGPAAPFIMPERSRIVETPFPVYGGGIWPGSMVRCCQDHCGGSDTTMSIHDDLTAELKDAMTAGDKARVNVIRQIESEISVAKSAPGFEGEVDDDLYLRTIATYVKKMDKARREYESAGERGAANAQKLAWEIKYLAQWLPQALGEDETRRTVRAAIAELKADDPKMMGRVIGHVMKNSGKDLDGALVNRIVREELGV